MQPLHTVSPIDENHMLFGNFIGLHYVFRDGLNTPAISEAVERLCLDLPVLCGRYDAKNRVVIAGPPITLDVREADGQALTVNPAPKYPDYINQPARKAVWKGRTPLSTFTLTQFKDGGTILGIAINHLLMDAAGYHMLMKRLADHYTSIAEDKVLPKADIITHLPVFDFGTGRSQSEIKADLKNSSGPKPIPLTGLAGSLIRSVIMRAMEKSLHYSAPVKLHFSAEQVARLKDTVHGESGEPFISTNTALASHLTALMATLSYAENTKEDIQIGQLLDLRGRYFQEDSAHQPDFIGNAILIHIETATFQGGVQAASRGELARYFTKRKARTDSEDVKTRLDNLADCLRAGYSNPQLDVKNPIISINNQSKMPVYALSFAGQRPAQIHPQDVGDNIMLFPAAGGGIDIYIRDLVKPGRQVALLTPEWQSPVFDF